MANMKQTTKLSIEIPKGHKWNVADLKEAIIKIGIKCEVIAVMNNLEIPSGLIKSKLKEHKRGK